MIESSVVFWASAAVQAVALVVLLGRLRGISASRRRYCYPVLSVLGVSLVGTVLIALGVGTGVGGTSLDAPGLVDDLIAYSVLWSITALLAGESRRMVGVFVVLPVIQVVAFNGGVLLGGAAGLVGLFVMVVGQVLLAYLLLGRVWERAQRVPDRQRLLHWKARNLLLFLIGMLIAFSLLSVAQVFDEFVVSTVGAYMDLLIRVGFAGFLFANVDAIEVDEAGDELLGAVRPEADHDRPDAAGGD
ncbi:bacteriorhodopsin [Halosimplex pelagicum]|uniref:Bacteriorhodopsin n=1 Tax=Halosimplex pelagicum TaxID=869886 RepID=A0A7D5PDL0_9EURY|nr:bacteriorhodopsin [Halosimplex pelagicum]QLH84605.1 bacteriorhodopsin [Halosimplex pelagicum]